MLSSTLAAAAIWLSISAGCDEPTQLLPILPNNFNPVYVCAITPLPLCGASYRLSSLADVSVTYRYTQYTPPRLEYTQPFPIPSHMYEIGADWGWTMIPPAKVLGSGMVLDMFAFTTPIPSIVALEPDGMLALATKQFSTNCYDILEVPADGIVPPPFNPRIKQ